MSKDAVVPLTPEQVARRNEGQAVASFMLGTFLAATMTEGYPVKIRERQEWVDEHEQIQAVTFVTESGLRIKVHMDFEGEEML